MTAGPPNSLYRFQKMVRRNTLLFAAGGAVTATNVLPEASFVSSRRAPFLFLKSLAGYRQGRYGSAVEDLESLGVDLAWLTLSPFEAQRCFLLALALYRSNEAEKARQLMREAKTLIEGPSGATRPKR